MQTGFRRLADTALPTPMLTHHVSRSRVSCRDPDIPPLSPVPRSIHPRRKFTMKKFVIASLLAAGSLAVQAKDIVDTAVAAGPFKTLATALQAAGLVDTLKGKGPFTVFAPTDAAFAATLSELTLTAAQLLASPDLAAILTYHALGSAVRAADVVALPKPAAVTTLQGSSFSVDAALALTDGRNRTANLVATDVEASNGVIHVIDNVLLPPIPH